MNTPDRLERAVERRMAEALGTAVEVRDMRGASGGSINRAAVLDTSVGEFFLKWNRKPIADLFEVEAEALREMRDSQTDLVIPEPVVATRPTGDVPAFLVLEYLAPGTRISDFDEVLGRGLAQLHRMSAEQFGFHSDNYCGTTPQPNAWCEDWIEFYREQRLRHQLRLAVGERGVSRSDRRAWESLLDRLDDVLGIDPEPPALIHGDLWSGNLHVTPEGRPSLIDPAAYYGHREAELGMMDLFGGFSDRVFAAYDEAWPLQDGWETRIELYSLYHVLNHYNLFGGSYGQQAMSIVRNWI